MVDFLDLPTCNLCGTTITQDNLGQSTELTILCQPCLEKVGGNSLSSPEPDLWVDLGGEGGGA